MPHPIPIENLSISKKRQLIVLERKMVARVVLRSDLRCLELQRGNSRETFDYNNCSIEVIDGELTDGLTDGLSLSY